MAAAELKIRQAFGIRTDVSGCLLFRDEHTLIYPCGNNLVISNTESHSQQFLSYATQGQGTSGLTALAITPNQRFVAVAEQGPTPIITIWDVVGAVARRKKVIMGKDLHCQAFVSMAFSPDSKYLAVQGGRPDWTLYYWNWEKPKLMASVKSTNSQGSPVHEVSGLALQYLDNVPNQYIQYRVKYPVTRSGLKTMYMLVRLSECFGQPALRPTGDAPGL